jgi:hypothetical protein
VKTTLNFSVSHVYSVYIFDCFYVFLKNLFLFSASEKVHGIYPDLTREGGSIPIVVSFAKVLEGRECPIVLLPIGAADDGAHSQNEKISRFHLFSGLETLGMYVHEFARR